MNKNKKLFKVVKMPPKKDTKTLEFQRLNDSIKKLKRKIKFKVDNKLRKAIFMFNSQIKELSNSSNPLQFDEIISCLKKIKTGKYYYSDQTDILVNLIKRIAENPETLPLNVKIIASLLRRLKGEQINYLLPKVLVGEQFVNISAEEHAYLGDLTNDNEFLDKFFGVERLDKEEDELVFDFRTFNNG